MKQRKIIVIRGYLAAGKSTTFKNLKLKKEMRNWVFLDFPAIRKIFTNDEKVDIELSDKVFFASLKEILKTKRNIVTQETSKEILMKKVGSEIKKYGYQIKVIVFEVSPKISFRRDRERRKLKGKKLRYKKDVYENYKNRKLKLSKEKFFINTEDLTEKGVIKEVMKII